MTVNLRRTMLTAEHALSRAGRVALVAVVLAPTAAAGTDRHRSAGTSAMRAVPLQPAAIMEGSGEAIVPAHRVRRGGPSGTGDGSWSIYIGHRRVGHYEFAKRMAALTQSDVAESMRAAYEPARPRSRPLMITGYVGGGAAVGVGAVMGAFYGVLARRACDVTSAAHDASGCAIHSGARTAGLAVGGLGLATLLLTGVYQALTTEPFDETTHYYTKSEAERLVDQYNRLVDGQQQGEGNGDRTPSAGNEQTSRTPRERPRLQWGLRLSAAGPTVVARF